MHPCVTRSDPVCTIIPLPENRCDPFTLPKPLVPPGETYRSLLQGGPAGASPAAEFPPPPQAADSFTGSVPTDEIQRLWYQLVQQSTRQVSEETGRAEQGKAKKTEDLLKLLRLALASGHLELAMLLMAGLEARETNALAGSLMERIQDLQQKRRAIADQIGGLKPEDSAQASSLNVQAGEVGTEIGLLQTFMQDLMAQKKEAEQLASNVLKSRHDTAEAIIRNVG